MEAVTWVLMCVLTQDHCDSVCVCVRVRVHVRVRVLVCVCVRMGEGETEGRIAVVCFTPVG